MAIGTFTASTFLQNPKQLHVGNQTRHFTFNGGTTQVGTNGDVVLLAKIPNKATIVDCWARINSGAAGSVASFCIVKGKTASETTTLGIIGSITTSAAAVRLDFRSTVAFAPFQISLSDDDGVQYARLVAVFTAGSSATSSVSMDGVIVWAMDAEA